MGETASPSKPWAMLAYTVADDKGGGRNIDNAAKEELKAICDASDFTQVSVAAQVDFTNTRGVFRAVLRDAPETREFEDVKPEDHPLWRAVNDKLKQSTFSLKMEREDLNAARGSVLQDFLQYGHAECPADRHVMFFYGHAHGPMGLFFDRDADRRSQKISLRLNDLAASMQSNPRPAALLVFRDCFMNTLESAYQFRGVAEFMIASQSLVPVDGIWPWAGLMSSLMASATSGDQALAFAKSLGRFLDDAPNRKPFADAPLSVIDLGAADAIVEPLKALVAALEAARTSEKDSSACAKALDKSRVGRPGDFTDPGDPSLLDVPTMCERLQEAGAGPVADAAKRLGDVVANQLVRWHHTQGKRYRGVSLYYKPATKTQQDQSCIYDQEFFEDDAANYKQLALSVATGWDRIALNPLK